MITLRYDGLRKVKEGITTVEEVLRSSNEGWAPPKKHEEKPSTEGKPAEGLLSAANSHG